MSVSPPVDLLALTGEIVDIPSVSRDEAALVDWLEQRLRAVSWLEVTRAGDNVVARTTFGRAQRLVLAGHTDTVPPHPGEERATVVGDRCLGVGSADMKSGLAVMLALAEHRADPGVDLTFVFYAREEIAAVESGLGELFDVRPDLLTGDAALLGEPTDGWVEAGCQGSMRLAVRLRGSGRTPLDRGWGAMPCTASGRCWRWSRRTSPDVPSSTGASTARRCRRCSSRAAWPPTWCPTMPRSPSTTGSRRTARRTRHARPSST